MTQMCETEMVQTFGGKKKTCGECGKTYRTWFTYTYHNFTTNFFGCLAYIVTHPW